MGSLFELLFGFLIDLLEWISVTFLNLLIDLLNAIIVAIAALMGIAISFLPSPTFDLSLPSGLSNFLSTIAWFFPVSTMIDCVGIIALAAAAYFIVKPILKFAHLT